MRRSIVALSLVIAGLGSACIIGPKQDDPANESTLVDAGTIYSDTSAGGSPDAFAASDTTPAPHDNDAAADGTIGDTAFTGDTAVDAADAVSDASDASDAAEGG